MSLTNRAAANFEAQVRLRGQSYYAAGRVTVKIAGRDLFVALVAGSRQYTVSLSWTPGHEVRALAAECSCPYFAEGALCKHIWASLLAADYQYRGQNTFAGSGRVAVDLAGDGGDTYYDYEGHYEEDDVDDDVDDEEESAGAAASSHSALVQRPPWGRSPLNKWRHAVDCLRLPAGGQQPGAPSPRDTSPKPGRLWYGLDIEATRRSGLASVALFQQQQSAKGAWGKIKEARLDFGQLLRFADSADREALAILLGCTPKGEFSTFEPYRARERQTRVELQPTVQASLLARLASTGRLISKSADEDFAYDKEPPTLAWDDGEAYCVLFKVEPAEAGAALDGDWAIHGELARPEDSCDVATPLLISAHGLVLFTDRVAQCQGMSLATMQWLTVIRTDGPIRLPAKDVDAFMLALKDAVSLPPLRVPAGFPWGLSVERPTPKLVIVPSEHRRGARQAQISGVLQFVYGDDAALAQGPAVTVDPSRKRLLVRDTAAEDAARSRLTLLATSVDLRFGITGQAEHYSFDAQIFAEVVQALDRDGWIVMAGTGRVKRAAEPAIKVASSPSGIDWFEVRANVDFDGVRLPLPDLLAALRRGEHFVRLGDGSVGLLPQDWLRRFGSLNRLGTADGKAWRFAGTQALLLDALLAAEPSVDADQAFAAVKQRLKAFAGIAPVAAPPGFAGTLRPYQEAGLAWLRFLADVGLGGCLADDMGLGKTIQVLALLQERLGARPRLPSVVVVPKSLVHNWVEEAGRFAPSLRVGVYAGRDRAALLRPDAGVDLIVMTYNMLRTDVLRLSAVAFDYAVLDEAQNIKNESAQVAKAARLIKARHRLALSGTPVENHLRELGSLFEFLNPGMLGDVLAPIKDKDVDLDAGSVAVLGAALRPLILRRTKEQVLPDLPAKTEQTLLCDFEPDEAKAYDDLRRHYQAALSKTIDREGLGKTKIVVLEALLRLRQAACHPGLIDKAKTAASSAKVDLLLAQLAEVVGGGHKALVFSQFTSLLAIVRDRLERAGLTYEYLDGKTRDRQARVERFQSDPQCSVFLISLKAGGVGLNLTAADYCYILDPWWNPAAEAQAVDRAHRIGQTKRVFAYRLITRASVEEKIVLLQQKKKKLADAIVQADESFLASMTVADLESLLSPG